MKDIQGRGILCPADKNCRLNTPCSYCISHPHFSNYPDCFTPEEQKEIDGWLEQNKDLMDDLAKDD